MNETIVAAIISAAGAIIAAIIGRLPLKQKDNYHPENNAAPQAKRKSIFSILSIILCSISLFIIISTDFFLVEKQYESDNDPRLIEKLNEATESTTTVDVISNINEESIVATSASKEDITTTEVASIPPDIEIGSIKKFGKYEQDDDASNGAEDIEWIVLRQDENEILVISALCLEPLPYAREQDTSDWNNSSIRKWLNGSFYKTAFSEEEQKRIIEKEIIQHKNEDYPFCDQGENTTDHIFLLSAQEYQKYMLENIDVKREYCNGILSTHAKKEGAELKYAPYCWWWLRTSGKDNGTACSVTAYGVLDPRSCSIRSEKGTVRPAMWITVE